MQQNWIWILFEQIAQIDSLIPFPSKWSIPKKTEDRRIHSFQINVPLFLDVHAQWTEGLILSVVCPLGCRLLVCGMRDTMLLKIFVHLSTGESIYFHCLFPQVYSINPKVVHRVMIHVVGGVVDEMCRLVQCVPNFNQHGKLQVCMWHSIIFHFHCFI